MAGPGSEVANVATTLLLVIIGVVGDREHLAARHVVGLLMCLGGLYVARYTGVPATRICARVAAASTSARRMRKLRRDYGR